MQPHTPTHHHASRLVPFPYVNRALFWSHCHTTCISTNTTRQLFWSHSHTTCISSHTTTQLFWSHSHTTSSRLHCINLQHVYTQTYGQQMVSSHPQPLRMGASQHVRVLDLCIIVKEHRMAMVGTHFGLLLLHSQLRQLLQEGRGPGEWLEAHGSYTCTCTRVCRISRVSAHGRLKFTGQKRGWALTRKSHL